MRNLKIHLIFALFFSFKICICQNSTISGFVYDKQNQERLIGAFIVDINANAGLVTNDQGFFSLAVKNGGVSLKVSYLGFKPDTIHFYLKRDTTLAVFLQLLNNIEEVTIIGQSTPLSYNFLKIQASQLNKLPVLGGMPDIMKSMQLLPGVQSTSEGQAGFSVHGGDDYQNQILLDGVPVYNSNHLYGFFSIFNENAIQDINLYKGDFPSQYGGGLSSVVDIHTREGNTKHDEGSLSVGLLASSANLEGPIFSEKTTFFVSARKSYINLIATPLIRHFSGYDAASYDFYDVNVKLTHRFSNNDKLSLSVYNSYDFGSTNSSDQSYSFSETNHVTWSNWLGSLTWNHVINNRMYLNTVAHYSHYYCNAYESSGQNDNSIIAATSQTTSSTIFDKGLTSNLTWYYSPKITIRTGAEFTHQKYMPGVQSAEYSNSLGILTDTTTNTGTMTSLSNMAVVYVQSDFKLHPGLDLHTGLRYSVYNNKVFYNNLEPRINLEYYRYNGKISLSCTMVHQYNHRLTTSQISQATDLWVPSTRNVLPEQAIQYAINLEHPLGKNYTAKVELYDKTYKHLLAYQSGSSYLNTSSWQDMVTTGTGDSRGLCLTLEKTIGRTTGWITYTLSKTNRRFELINKGVGFPFDYDHRHDIKVVVLHQFSPKWDVGFNWVYHSGNFVSYGTSMDESGYIYIRRNAYELPVYHRLDVSLNYHIKKRHMEQVIAFGLYNAYNRKNIYSVNYYLNQLYYYQKASLYFVEQKCLFPIIPSLTYRINFR